MTSALLLLLWVDGVRPSIGALIDPSELRVVVLVGVSVGGTVLLSANSARAQRVLLWQVSRLGLASAVLPRTPRTAMWFVPVALTAGVTEEFIFRGVAVYWANHALPTFLLTPIPWAPVFCSAAAFGALHLYQGWRGVALTFVLGGLFSLLTARTGSLLPAMAIHALLDLRIAFLFRVWKRLP